MKYSLQKKDGPESRLFNPSMGFFLLTVAVVLAIAGSARAQSDQNSSKADLAFDRAGKITTVHVKAGDHVTAGQPLAELDKSDLLPRLKDAQGNAEIQKAKLADLRGGVHADVLKSQELALESAKINLESAKMDLLGALQDAYIKADDTVRDKAGQLFQSAGSTPQPALAGIDLQSQIDLINRRIANEQLLVSWKSSLDATDEHSDLASYVQVTKTNLRKVQNFLDIGTLVVNNIFSDPNVSQVTLRNWRLDLFTARSNIVAALRAIAAGLGKVKDADVKVRLQEYQLTFQKAGPSDTQIMLQEGLAKQAEAQVDAIQAEIGKTILISPFNGVVKKIYVRRGSAVNRGTGVMSLSQ